MLTGDVLNVRSDLPLTLGASDFVTFPKPLADIKSPK